MIKIAIVDDDVNACEVIHSHLERFNQNQNLEFQIKDFPNGMDFLESHTSEFDLVFLDVEMPLMNGIEASKKLRKANEETLIIFVTNIKKYALEGYQVGALDYILKPINYYSFEAVFKRALKIINSKIKSEILISSEGITYRIATDDIRYVEVGGHGIHYHLTDKELNTWGSLQEVIRKLPPEEFYRLSGSYLINLNHVTSYDNDFVYLKNEKLRFARGKKKEFVTLFAAFLGEK